jgi:hypothetical protein
MRRWGSGDPSTAPRKSTFQGVLEFFEKRLNKSKIPACRLVICRWASTVPTGDTPDIDVEYHIRHIAPPKPGATGVGCIQAALHARPLDMTMLAWECYA